MSTSALRFEFANYCPHLACGEVLQDQVARSSRFCVYCGAGINSCGLCQATNRLFASYCRGCGDRLQNDIFPLQNGLRDPEFLLPTIETIEPPLSAIPFRLDGAVLAHPVAANGVIVVCLQTGVIVLVSEFQRQELGRIEVTGEIHCTPVLQDGLLCVAADRSVLAFDLAKFLEQPSRLNALPEWTFEINGSVITQPLLANRTLLFLTTREGAQTVLEAVGLANGQRLWSQPLRFDTTLTTPPVLVNHQLLMLTQSGQAHFIDAITGQTIECLELGRTIALQVQPVVCQNRVLFADSSGNLLEIGFLDDRPQVKVLYHSQARITALAASPDLIAFGHLSGLTLLNAHGHLIWSNDNFEAISLNPLIAGKSVLALDDQGNGLLMGELRAMPTAKVKLLSGDLATPPIITRAKIIAVNAGGDVMTINWH